MVMLMMTAQLLATGVLLGIGFWIAKQLTVQLEMWMYLLFNKKEVMALITSGPIN